MELKKAILERRSIRAFSEKPVEKNLLKELLTAGIYAPTAGNIQPWLFFSITDPDGINKIRTISPGMLSDPKALICVCSDQKKAFERAVRPYLSWTARWPHRTSCFVPMTLDLDHVLSVRSIRMLCVK